MKKLQIILLLFLLSCRVSFSQTKKIEGDTVYWEITKELQKTLKLKDFEKSNDDFNFRFSTYGQVIEITKDSLVINGTISNYIYHTKKTNSSKRETLYNKVILLPEQAKILYDIVQDAKILNLASSKEIEKWKFGADGTTYIIEHSDKNNYWIKSYWEPSSQDSIAEALIVLNLIKNFSSALKLQETYTAFKNDLPKNGCYNSGSITNMCYTSNSIELGYSAATKLPLGFYGSFNVSFIGKTEINSGVFLQYNFDNNGFHHLNFQSSKWNIFYKKSEITDFIVYNYQNRKIKNDKVENRLQNHQIKYGLNLKKNISIGAGLDYLTGKYEEVGAQLYAFKWFSKPNISTSLTSSIFGNEVNYKAEMHKSFNFNYRFPIRRLSLGIAYEDFMSYKDLYFNLRVAL